MLIQSLRMTQRDWRASELRFLLIALIIAVAALSSVSFFTDRMRTGLKRDAHQLLGADLVINADHPLPPAWRAEAQRRGLAVAETVVFSSMALAGEGDNVVARLSSVKAVTAGYPLRGSLKITSQAGLEGSVTHEVPASGTVWVDANLLSGMHLNQGDKLKLGDKSFTIGQMIATEPDRGAAFINFAPRVMLSADDLADTHLIQAGSRVTYRLMLAAPAASQSGDVVDYQKWVQTRIDATDLRGVSLESLESGRPEMRATLDRAEQFLSLVSLLSAMLAAVAVAMAARRFMLRHLDACAMLRFLGLTQNQVTLMYLIEFLALGLAGSALGALAGFGAHFALLAWLGTLISNDLPPASWTPALQGVATGLLLLVGFALPPILQLRNVSHNRVIRRERDAPQAMTLLAYVLGICVLVGLLLWQAGNVKLGLLTAGGFLGALLLFSLIAWLGLKSLQKLRTLVNHASWRFAVTSLQRRPGASVVQIVALAMGMMALLLLTVVRSELVGAWRDSTPPDAPNRFVINIQPDQKPALEAHLAHSGVRHPLLFPMIRGRLVTVNGKSTSAATAGANAGASATSARASSAHDSPQQDERARRMLDREFNISTMTDLPPENKITAGRWYHDLAGQPEASVETGLADTLGLKLGDKLRFDIGGQVSEATVTSLRKLDWSSMKVNFYVIINPRAMADMPQTWITSFYLPPQQSGVVDILTRDFPNLTIIDTGSVLKQIQTVLNQVITAVEFLFLFALASGVLVLYAALMGSQDERMRESGLLRALGATRRQLSQAQTVEFLLVGGLAGFLAASGAAAVGWGLMTFVFEFAWTFRPEVWLAGVLAGAVCAIAGGWLGLRDVLNQPPLQTLRGA
jgi:putative ABC transport system permease protein